MLSYSQSIREGKSHQETLKEASKQALQSGGTAIVVGVMTQQLLRTSVGRTMAASATYASRTVIDAAYKTEVGRKVLVKTAETLAKKQLGNEAAKQILVKGMRSNAVVGGVMLAAQTIPDAVKVCQGKMSAGQFCKNTASNAAGIGTGYAGATVGAAIGTVAIPIPGVGSAIGGIVGGVVGGITGSSVVKGFFSLFD